MSLDLDADDVVVDIAVPLRAFAGTPGDETAFTDAGNAFRTMRTIKRPEEIARLRKASDLTDRSGRRLFLDARFLPAS